MFGLQEWLLANSSAARDQDRSVTVEEREVIRRRMRMDKWTLDRGAGYYADERVKKKLPCLVQKGKHAGRSRVRYVGVDFQTFWTHVLRRDFYTTAVNAALVQLVAVLVVWYFLMLLSWSTVYYAIWRWNEDCFIGFHGFRSAFMYATETQQTIGYGERATGECWVAALGVSIHSLQAVLFDSVILGIVFSRISHPKQRSRTVLISDCACIARRDGQLKFMFRIADIQMRSVIDPRVRVVLYTWGPRRRTAEGERLPVVAQEMSVQLDRNLLLPVTVEHTIDEASPLQGHTLHSLEAVGAEVVVTFEASSELGDTFMSRQSYLPSEVHWGHTFANVIRPALGDTQHEVDLSRFHDVEPQPGLGDEMTHPHRLSRKVMSGGGPHPVVPCRLLRENTLVLGQDAVVAARGGRPYLMFRLGDTFPGHVTDVQVTAFLYRWHATHTPEGEFLPYEQHPLTLEPTNIMLRYPVTLVHELDERSPVAHWASQKGMRQDADAEVVLTARGTLCSSQEVVTRTRVYSAMGDIKWGHAFLPVVLPAGASAAAHSASTKLGAAVEWSNFHATAPVAMHHGAHALAGLQPTSACSSPRPSNLGYSEPPGGSAAGGGGGPGGRISPHAGARLFQVRQQHAALLHHSASAGSISGAPAHNGGGLLPEPTAMPAEQPHPHTRLAPAHPHSQQLQQPPPVQRIPSSWLLAQGGAHDLIALRPPSSAAAGTGTAASGRRTDEGTLAADSDDLSSPEGTIGFGTALPPLPPVSGGYRHPSVTHVDKHSERTWHQTRSLFAALEGIQHHLQEEQRQGSGRLSGADSATGMELV